MNALLPLVIACVLASPLAAENHEQPPDLPLFFSMDEVELSQFKWKNRPVVVFADSALDPAFVEQMSLLRAREDELRARDVVVISDTDPDTLSALRRKLRPRGFMLTLIGKDGGVKIRKPFPWDVREISRSIDKMPIRKREIREEKERAAQRRRGPV